MTDFSNLTPEQVGYLLEQGVARVQDQMVAQAQRRHDEFVAERDKLVRKKFPEWSADNLQTVREWVIETKPHVLAADALNYEPTAAEIITYEKLRRKAIQKETSGNGSRRGNGRERSDHENLEILYKRLGIADDE